MNNNKERNFDERRGKVNPNSIKEYKVYVETTLLDFLLFKMGKSLSRNAIKHLLSKKMVAVGGVPVSQFDYRLYPEDTVIVSKLPIKPKAKSDLKIIYEDDLLLVIDKPTRLLSVESDKEKGRTAYHMASDYLRRTDPKTRLFVVHRLDEDTSGVLVFAKDYDYKEALQRSWSELCLKRGYYAVVEGHLPPSGTYRDYLLQDKNGLMHLTNDKKNGKLCITNFKRLEENKDYSLLDVNIETGRKNQIRVQLGTRGHYVVGDDKYGEPSDPLGRLGLHAYELDLKCPYTGKVFRFVSKMPYSFMALFKKKGGKA